MNVKEQEEAVAELCGWKQAYIREASCGGTVFEHVWFPPGFEPHEQTAEWIAWNGRISPPSYTTDLNAVHEAEACLTDSQYVAFSSQLDEIIAQDGFDSGARNFCGVELPSKMLRNYSATASQRVRAILRSRGRWIAPNP